MLNEKESDNRKIVKLSHGAAAAAAEIEVDGIMSLWVVTGYALLYSD